MKVYYNVPDMAVELNDQQIADILILVPEIGKQTVEENLHACMRTSELFLQERAEKIKYKVMWLLRGLEDEIGNESGMIIISNDSIDVRNYSAELTDKIVELLQPLINKSP